MVAVGKAAPASASPCIELAADGCATGCLGVLSPGSSGHAGVVSALGGTGKPNTI